DSRGAPQGGARSPPVRGLPVRARRGGVGTGRLQPPRQQGQPAALGCGQGRLEAWMAGGQGVFGRLAAAFARLRGAGPRDPDGARSPDGGLREHAGYVSLQLRGGQTQSRMRGDAPDHLLIDYTRTMLATLLWQPHPARIGLVGLGGGSQVKFLYRQLPGARLE